MSKPQQKQKNSALAELIEEQKLLCEEFGSAYIAVSGDDVIAVAVQTLNKDPIVGLRKAPEGEEKVAWYIYGGELGEDEVSFETMPVRELQDILPDVLPYLALEQGYRFMIDADDYEDVWKEGDASQVYAYAKHGKNIGEHVTWNARSECHGTRYSSTAVGV